MPMTRVIAPSIGGLNAMLKLCDNYATVYNVIFNDKKTVCIKFGNEVIRIEAAFLKTINPFSGTRRFFI